MSDGGCSQCKRLEKRLAELQAKLEELEPKLTAATKNSSNSSKPPSSDLVKPSETSTSAAQSNGKKTKRKQGGQKGHKRSVRPEIPEDKLDCLVQYSYEACPDCGGPLTVEEQAPKLAPKQTLQQVEVVTQPIQAGHPPGTGLPLQ